MPIEEKYNGWDEVRILVPPFPLQTTKIPTSSLSTAPSSSSRPSFSYVLVLAKGKGHYDSKPVTSDIIIILYIEKALYYY
jgi:hypothetical protein